MSDIRLDPRNARRHPDQNKAMIRQSLEEIGGFRSIAVDGDGIIRAGNGVYEQAVALGLKIRIIEAARDELIAVKRSDLVGELAERAAILDNRTAELAEWDANALAWLKENESSVVEGMWDAREWRTILSQIEQPETENAPEAQIDKAEELRQKWGVELGQLWEIPSLKTHGQVHRLLCGDSTNLEHVARLMNGQRAVLFSTDPPYLVDYKGDDHPGGGKDWTNHYFDEDVSAQGDGGLYDGFISAARKLAITEDAAWYCWHASRRQMMVEQAWIKHGAFMHQQIIWVKDRPILTYSWYMWQHEPCMMGWVKGHKPERGATDIISGVWDYPSPTGEERVEHPTQKPVEVFIIPILQNTDPGDLCYEPFSGSGTQLVAAESTGRICFAMEKSPAFVSVALERLAGFGLSPKKVEGGQE